MEKKDTLSSCSESEEQQMQLIQDKSKESCMVSFQRLHSHLKCLLNNDLKGSRTEDGFKRAFATLFGQDFGILQARIVPKHWSTSKRILITMNFKDWIHGFFNVLEDTVQISQNSVRLSIHGNVKKVDWMERALSVIIKSNGTETQKQDTSSRSGNDADIIPIYDEEPMAEVQMTADDNVSAQDKQHIEQTESNNGSESDQNG
ncbi:hypothetical protein Tco_1146266 [Tanacetum coccineum]